MSIRTWTFAEDEGGTTVVEADMENLVLHLYSGPDCDRTTTERHIRFVATDDPERDGEQESTGPMRWDTSIRYALKPDDAFIDYLFFELGSTLYCHPLLTQPED